jgi:hypothetical protein
LSHFKERAEKNCLNCNTEVHGRFCHICGQENRAKGNGLGAGQSFFHDITHFDGKFFTSLKVADYKTGFLSRVYHRAKGKASEPYPDVCVYRLLFFILFLVFLRGLHVISK